MGLVVGFSGKLSKTGAATVMTAEATTQIGVTKTYQITNAAKRVLDPTTAIVIKISGTPVVLTNILNINLMNGEVTFIAAFTPGAPPTFDGKYLPKAAISKVKNGQGTPKRLMQDVTQANQGATGYIQRAPTVIDFTGKFSIWDYLINQSLDTIFNGQTPFLLEIDPDGSGSSVLRAWVILTMRSGEIQGKVINETDLDFELFDQSDVATALNGVSSLAAIGIGTT